MTRGQIKAAARSEAGIGASVPSPIGAVLTPGADDPILLDRWVDAAVMELCRVTDYTSLTFTTDIVSGQQSYCLPDLQYFESAQAAADPAAAVNGLPLTPVTLAVASLRDFHAVNPAWRATLAQTAGTPNTLVIEGAAMGVLYPLPNYSAIGGLTISGLGTVTNAAWSNETDPCPLLPRCHDAVVYRVAQRLSERARDAANAQRCEREWKRGKNLLEGEMHRLSESHRHRFAAGAFRLSPGGLNPLDQ